MSSATQSDKVRELIYRLDNDYSKGLMSPEEYGVLRHGLELRLGPPRKPVARTPTKKRRHFRLKLIMIAIIAILVLVTIPFFMRSSNRPDFQISNAKLENNTLSFTLKNKGTADAHEVKVTLRQSDTSKGEIQLARSDILKPEDTLSVNKAFEAVSNAPAYGVRFNIVVVCKEGVTLNYPYP